MKISMSGVAYQVLAGSNWPTDEPEGWAQVRATKVSVRHGFGVKVAVDVEPAVAISIADHLESVAEMVATMTYEEAGDSGRGEQRASRAAVEAIRKVVNAAGEERVEREPTPPGNHVLGTFGWNVVRPDGTIAARCNSQAGAEVELERRKQVAAQR